jgi:predicted membrane channel-forming protein YqfA (hemolysin III family)
VLHDPYERINFWSHFLPGVAFSILSLCSFLGMIHGGTTLSLFTACATTTHLLSALTHVWPDNHALEKCDHVGIVALIVGTPLTAAMAVGPGNDLGVMGAVALALVAAAFMPPLFRTVTFVGLGALLFFSYFYIVNFNFCAQVALYLLGAASFIRNSGHDRWTGWTDHHMLHYTVTAACMLHVCYILTEVKTVS